MVVVWLSMTIGAHKAPWAHRAPRVACPKFSTRTRTPCCRFTVTPHHSLPASPTSCGKVHWLIQEWNGLGLSLFWLSSVVVPGTRLLSQQVERLTSMAIPLSHDLRRRATTFPHRIYHISPAEQRASCASAGSSIEHRWPPDLSQLQLHWVESLQFKHIVGLGSGSGTIWIIRCLTSGFLCSICYSWIVIRRQYSGLFDETPSQTAQQYTSLAHPIGVTPKGLS